MAGGALFYYLYEVYQKRKERKYPVEKLIEQIPVIVVQNPVISSEIPPSSAKSKISEKVPILVRNPSHKKLKEFLPSSQ